MIANPISLGESVTVVVRHKGAVKKVLKLAYSKRFADFYIMFPYLVLSEYRCGIREISEPGSEVTFDVTKDSEISPIPAKLTYQESGQFHFKPVNPAQSLSPSVKLAEIKTIPISQLNGEHIFTVQFEGLSSFEDAAPKPKKGDTYVELAAPDNNELFKLVGFAGLSQQSIMHKYGVHTTPHINITFTRPSLQTPLYLGIYAVGGTSVRTDGNKPYILVLGGFAVAKDNSKVRFLFLDGAVK